MQNIKMLGELGKSKSKKLNFSNLMFNQEPAEKSYQQEVKKLVRTPYLEEPTILKDNKKV